MKCLSENVSDRHFIYLFADSAETAACFAFRQAFPVSLLYCHCLPFICIHHTMRLLSTLLLALIPLAFLGVMVAASLWALADYGGSAQWR